MLPYFYIKVRLVKFAKYYLGIIKIIKNKKYLVFIRAGARFGFGGGSCARYLKILGRAPDFYIRPCAYTA